MFLEEEASVLRCPTQARRTKPFFSLYKHSRSQGCCSSCRSHRNLPHHWVTGMSSMSADVQRGQKCLKPLGWAMQHSCEIGAGGFTDLKGGPGSIPVQRVSFPSALSLSTALHLSVYCSCAFRQRSVWGKAYWEPTHEPLNPKAHRTLMTHERMCQMKRNAGLSFPKAAFLTPWCTDRHRAACIIEPEAFTTAKTNFPWHKILEKCRRYPVSQPTQSSNWESFHTTQKKPARRKWSRTDASSTLDCEKWGVHPTTRHTSSRTGVKTCRYYGPPGLELKTCRYWGPPGLELNWQTVQLDIALNYFHFEDAFIQI